jgi:hypothetical protein
MACKNDTMNMALCAHPGYPGVSGPHHERSPHAFKPKGMIMLIRTITLTAFLVIIVPAQFAALPGDETPAPVELGRVDWQGDLDAALKASAAAGKPVLLLFQEIPG